MRVGLAALALCVALAVPAGLHAQGRGGRGAGAAATGRTAALKDLTGYWVSVVAEHWHLRMLVPPKGNFEMLPLNAEARRVANTWDPVKESEPCKSYGAAAIMRVPTRLHVMWQDDNTLRIDTDAGTQTRLFHFGAFGAFGATTATPSKPTWQGYSAALWDRPASLKVITTNMQAGYLRKNGVPYSENAVLTEYFDLAPLPNGGQALVVTAVVDDSRYLQQPFIVSSQFKKEADASKWDPTPCFVK